MTRRGLTTSVVCIASVLAAAAVCALAFISSPPENPRVAASSPLQDRVEGTPGSARVEGRSRKLVHLVDSLRQGGVGVPRPLAVGDVRVVGDTSWLVSFDVGRELTAPLDGYALDPDGGYRRTAEERRGWCVSVEVARSGRSKDDEVSMQIARMGDQSISTARFRGAKNSARFCVDPGQYVVSVVDSAGSKASRTVTLEGDVTLRFEIRDSAPADQMSSDDKWQLMAECISPLDRDLEGALDCATIVPVLPYCSLSGRVLDNGADDLRAVAVDVTISWSPCADDSESSIWNGSAVVDRSGRFSLAGLPCGVATVIATLGGSCAAAAAILSRDNDTAHFALQLRDPTK